jgi:spore maturation protein CgeB
MKILVSGYHNPHYLTVTDYIERAIRLSGHGLSLFNDRKHIFPGRLRRKVAFLQKLSLLSINRAFVDLAEHIRPDGIVVTGGHRISRGALQRLSKLKTRLVLWTTDVPRVSDIMLQTAPLYKHIFCQGTEYRDLFHENGLVRAEWLPMACDPFLHGRVTVSADEQKQFGSDIAFVGSFYPERAELLQALTDQRLAVWGPGWEVLPADSRLHRFIRGSHTNFDAWVKIYSASRIVLSIHYRNSRYPYPVHQASPRVFEAMACGAFVLTDRQKDVLTLFKDGQHLVTFSDADDLKKKITHYLNHEEERRNIAEAGKREVLSKHTYPIRVQHLLARAALAVSNEQSLLSNTHPHSLRLDS